MGESAPNGAVDRIFQYGNTHRKRPLSKLTQYIIYGTIIAVGLLAMYSILNAGNPESLLRHIFSNPQSDIYVAAVSSFAVFVLGFVIFFNKDREGFRNLIEMNGRRIRSMRSQGKSDGEIADSILEAMGGSRGYRYKMARKKLIIYLSEFQ
jgi:hypothetical protein